MSKLRWMNIPIPPQYLVAILLGLFLHLWQSQRLFALSWISQIPGWPLLLLGIWLSIRAAVEAGEMSIESPTRLLTTGLYSRSRNPMYVGWTIIHLGIALIANSIWILALLPMTFAFTHLVDIQKEEQGLLSEFGDQYLEYQEKVRRYI